MRKDGYYDGPVIGSDLTVDELEKEIEEEIKKCEQMDTWEEY